MNALLSLIQSGAVAVIAVMFASALGARLERRPGVKTVLIGLVFGGVAILSMLSPVEVAEGFRVDARNVLVGLSLYVGGPVAAVLTALLAIGMRFWLGGAGAMSGFFGVAVVTVVASLVWVAFKLSRRSVLGGTFLITLAVAVGLAPVLTVLIMSSGNFELNILILTYVVPTNIIGILALGRLLLIDRERQWASDALRDEQARLLGIANNAPGVLFQLQFENEDYIGFRYISDGASRVLGVSPDAPLNNSKSIRQILSRESYAAITEKLAQSAQTMQPWTLETEITRLDGREVWVRTAAEPRYDSSDQLVWDGSIFDITEQKKAEQRKADFVSTVSHELRTPLTSIRGSLGLIAGGAAGTLPEKADNLLRIAYNNAQRLVLLINDILDIEKIESDRMVFAFEPHEASGLVQSAIDLNAGYLVERQVHVEYEAPEEPVIVNVDAHRFNQVMLNLLSNAVKYSPVGGTVFVRMKTGPETVEISIRDVGPGIMPAFHDRIFGKFEQADASSSRQKGGTGLGLSIAKAIVERFGGTIGFESEPGTGARFYFTLPRIAQSEALPEISGDDGGQRVLVCVEDDKIADLIVRSLSGEGYGVDLAKDAEAAQGKLSEHAYIALTLDIALPAGASAELLATVRANPATQTLPVIVISAEIDATRKQLNGSAIGIIDWLEKPIDPSRLKAAVRSAAENRSAGRPSVLHVEDDKDILEVIKTALQDDVDMALAETAQAARDMLATKTFDVVILDLELPDGRGESLLSLIPRGTAVVIFSASDVQEALASKVQMALTKTKTSELAIADVVRGLAQKNTVSTGS